MPAGLVLGLIGALGLIGVGMGTLWARPAAAESPRVVAEQLALDGAYVAPERRDVDEAPLVAQANRARALGLNLVVVVPSDPQPDPRSFARRILEASTADVALVFPPGGGLEVSVIDEFRTDSARALTAARAKAGPDTATEAYITELLAAPSQAVPPIVSTTMLAVVALAGVLAATVVLEQVLRRKRRPGAVPSRPNATSA